MKIREFKKAYAAHIAGGKKVFDNYLIAASIGVILFTILIWYLPNETTTEFRIQGVVMIFYAGVFAATFAQIIHDTRLSPALRKHKIVYLRYMLVKAFTAFLIITILYVIAVGPIMLAV